MAITRSDIKWAVQSALVEEAVSLPEDSRAEVLEFIKTEATYEQILNLYYNRNTDVYTEAAVLEGLFLTENADILEEKKSAAKKAAEVVEKPGVMKRVGSALSKAGHTVSSPVKNLATSAEKKLNKAVNARYKAKNAGMTTKALSKLGDAAGHVKMNAGKYTGGLAVASAVGGYLAYRIMRKKGASQSQAAQAAAAKAKSPAEKAKWLAKAKAAKAKGK